MREKYTSRMKDKKVARQGLVIALVLSVFPALLIHFANLEGIVELYIASLVYTFILMVCAYMFYMHYQDKVGLEIKDLVKKERIISGELLMINTEEKLKNVMSLEFERCYNQKIESSIIFFDVDELGEINSKYGYNIGDQVVIEIIMSTKNYMEISDTIRGSGAVLARIKGDTFALVLPSISVKRAYIETETLKTVIEQLDLGITEKVTCRFAVLSMQHWISEDKFLELAYEKLKLAKSYGKGVIV